MSFLTLRAVSSIRAPASRVARQFSVSAFAQNETKAEEPQKSAQDKLDALDLSNTKGMSPEQVLQIAFRRMTEVPNYRKSEAELSPLISAGKKLGISESDIRQIYERTSIEKGLKSHSSIETESSDSNSQESNPTNAAVNAIGADSGFVPGSQAEVQYLNATVNTKFNVADAHRPFQYDDIPALGHLALRDHRVQREYNRVAAYELPQLSKYATPYRPISKDQVLQFRYTTYMGEKHPGESKVIVTFKTNDLTDLDDKQRHKLRLLAGTRYDHETDIVKISSQIYPQSAQNVRYLGEIIRDLLAEAKDLSKDSFEDIPLNINHVEARKRRNKTLYPTQFKFPEEWKRPQDAPKPKSDAFTQLAKQYIQIPKI